MIQYGKEYTCAHGEQFGECCPDPDAVEVRSNGHRPDASVDPVDTGWEDPIRIEAAALPMFPRSTLLGLQPMVDATAESLQVPVDLAALTALAVVSGAIGGRRVVEVRPDWTELVTLFVLTALPSGERKSPALKALARPLIEAEDRLVREAFPGLSQHAQNLRIAQARLAECEKAAARSTATPQAMAAAVGAREEVDRTGEPPAPPRLLVDDVTPESLGKHMGEQRGRISVFTAEAGLFSTLAGRYASGTPNLDLVLKAHCGDQARIDRIGRDPVLLPHPCLTLCLAVQPGVLEGLGSNRGNGFRATGLLARWLYGIPVGYVGRREADPAPIPAKVREEYGRRLDELVAGVWQSEVIETMHLSERAADALRTFRIALEPRLAPLGDLAGVADWASKLPGALVRIAAILALFDDPRTLAVSEEHMRAALDMADYLTAHARRAFDLLHGDKDNRLTPARSVLAWLRREPRDQFTVRDAHRALNGQAWLREPPGGLGEAERVRAAVTALEQYGWVMTEQADDRHGPGRPPSPTFRTHPRLREKA